MKRLTVSLFTLVLVTLGLAMATPAQAAPAQVGGDGASIQILGCQTLTHLSSYTPPPYGTYISNSEGRFWRQGHFITSDNCAEHTFSYFSRGVAFDDSACVDVKLIFYNRYHHFDRDTPWYSTCTLPVIITVTGHREFSFDVRVHDSAFRTRQNWPRFDPAIF